MTQSIDPASKNVMKARLALIDAADALALLQRTRTLAFLADRKDELHCFRNEADKDRAAEILTEIYWERSEEIISQLDRAIVLAHSLLREVQA